MMPRPLHKSLILAGRALLGIVFLTTAAGHLVPNFTKISEQMEAQSVPLPSVTLVIGLIVLLTGSLSIILGFWSRIGALLLFIFLALTCYFMHPFWKFEPGSGPRENELVHFFKNLALMGAMLLVMAHGSGPWSFDAQHRKR